MEKNHVAQLESEGPARRARFLLALSRRGPVGQSTGGAEAMPFHHEEQALVGGTD